jgi:hypothetical protein
VPAVGELVRTEVADERASLVHVSCGRLHAKASFGERRS